MYPITYSGKSCLAEEEYEEDSESLIWKELLPHHRLEDMNEWPHHKQEEETPNSTGKIDRRLLLDSGSRSLGIAVKSMQLLVKLIFG